MVDVRTLKVMETGVAAAVLAFAAEFAAVVVPIMQRQIAGAAKTKDPFAARKAVVLKPLL